MRNLRIVNIPILSRDEIISLLSCLNATVHEADVDIFYVKEFPEIHDSGREDSRGDYWNWTVRSNIGRCTPIDYKDFKKKYLLQTLDINQIYNLF